MTRVPYNEGRWEKRELPRASSPDSVRCYVHIDDVRKLLIGFANLSLGEQKVYVMNRCLGISEPSKVAQVLNWKSRGSVKNVQKRIERKMQQLKMRLRSPLEICSEPESEDNAFPVIAVPDIEEDPGAGNEDAGNTEDAEQDDDWE